MPRRGRKKGKKGQLGTALINKKGKKKKVDTGAASRPKRKTGPDAKLYIQTSELINENSILETNPLEQFLAEALADQRAYKQQDVITVIRARDSEALEMEIDRNFRKIEVFDYENLPIPRRPDWDTATTKEELQSAEEEAFINWRRSLAKTIEERGHTAVTPYEKNLNMWRQLWRVVERSQVIIQIIDARNPLAFLCKDLITYISEISNLKETVLLVNKADYLSRDQRRAWAKHFQANNLQYLFFSALREQLNQDLLSDSNREKLTDLQLEVLAENTNVDGLTEFEASCELMDGEKLLDILLTKAGDGRLMVGMVGYPNVGKSSVINVLVQQKKVAVACTPGKTKHFQTIVLNENVTLCDCPGLVFPTFMSSKSDLVLNGVIPVDNLRDFLTPVRHLCSRVPIELVNHFCKLDLPSNSLAPFVLDSFARSRGYMLRTDVPNRSEASRKMLKAFVRGELLYCHPPPNLTAEERADFCAKNTQLQCIIRQKMEALARQHVPEKVVETKIDLPKPAKREEELESADVGESQTQSVENLDSDVMNKVMGIEEEPLWDQKLGASRRKHQKKQHLRKRHMGKNDKRKNRRQKRFFEAQPDVSSAVPSNVTRVDRWEMIGLQQTRQQSQI